MHELGCFGLVLEKIPAKVSKKVTNAINIPVIGIGAGSHVNGQVLVTHDLVGPVSYTHLTLPTKA